MKKNKKKVISILALVASFVLCIGATFGITMAYFGGNDTAKLNNITLKTGIVVGAAIEAKSVAENMLVVPGQPIDIEATGTVSAATGGSANASQAVKGLLRAKLTITATDITDVTPTIDEGENAAIGSTSAGGFWKLHGGYYYLVTTEGGTTLQEVEVGKIATIKGKADIPYSIKNDMSGKTISASVVFEVIQSELYNQTTGAQVTALTIEDATVQAAFSTVAPTTPAA